MKTYIQVEHPLLTNKYTKVFCEPKEEQEFNAPHHFKVIVNNESVGYETIGNINFQCGPIKENGVNGICDEDLLVMVIKRLESFQDSEFRCRDNAMVITKLEEALLWLRKRTIARENRGVEGTNKV